MRPYVVSHLNAKATQIDNSRRFTLPGESRNACRIASLLIKWNSCAESPNFVQRDTSRGFRPEGDQWELHDDAFQCCSR